MSAISNSHGCKDNRRSLEEVGMQKFFKEYAILVFKSICCLHAQFWKPNQPCQGVKYWAQNLVNVSTHHSYSWNGGHFASFFGCSLCPGQTNTMCAHTATFAAIVIPKLLNNNQRALGGLIQAFKHWFMEHFDYESVFLSFLIGTWLLKNCFFKTLFVYTAPRGSRAGEGHSNTAIWLENACPLSRECSSVCANSALRTGHWATEMQLAGAQAQARWLFSRFAGWLS